jgi:hypothetical protein
MGSCEAATLSQSCQVTRPVNDADNHQRIGLRTIISRVRALEGYPQARCKLFALGTGKREMAQRLEMCRDESRCDLFRSLCCQAHPDFCQISFGSFGSFGKAQG